MPTDPSSSAGRPIESAAPSTLARVLALGAIVLGGAAGGLIGFAFIDIQCEGDCDAWNALGGLVGAVAGAVGLAIIAVLTLRAMAEWEALEAQRRLDDDD
ncbi:MAG: hypothetical protein OES57_11950 [Acidimicrobiia bacterium]|nr:hypothetical protein [Acidimicrobiia bacterium]